MSDDWRDLSVYDEETGHQTTFGRWVEELRAAAASGGAEAAFDGILELAVSFHQIGMDQPALELVDELATFVAERDVSPERWPWWLNTRGLALSGLGRYAPATEAFTAMRALGEALEPGPDAEHIISTALQNQGILEVEVEAPERALEPLRRALEMKLGLEDWVSTIDVLNSLALATAGTGDLDRAERMLASVEELATMIGERSRIATAHGNLGNLHTRRGDHAAAEAEYRQALRLARADGDTRHEILGVMNIGSSLADQSRPGEALRWYRRGARYAEEIGAAALESRLRRSVALMLVRLGRDREAEQEMVRALTLADAVGHPLYSAECRADLGALLWQRGSADAESLLSAAREEFLALGDERWVAYVDNNLAEVAVAAGDLDTADARWTEAADALADDPDTAAAVARRAAHAAVTHGDVHRAERWVGVELDRAERFEHRAALAWRRATAGALLNWRQTSESGLALLQRALDDYAELDDDVQAAMIRIDAANALSDLGRQDDAVAYLEECLALAGRREDRALRQRALGNLGEVFRRRGDVARAMDALTEALQLARDLRDEDAVLNVLGNLALSYVNVGDDAAAVEAASEQLALARRLGDRRGQGAALGALANVDFLAGRFKRASSRYRRAAELEADVSAVGEVESLGGWLESTAAAGVYDEIEPVAQRLAEAAQAFALGDRAATAFARTANRLLVAGERERSAALYAAGILLSAAEAADVDDEGEQLVEALGSAFVFLVSSVEEELPSRSTGAFYDVVFRALDEIEAGVGKDLRPLFDRLVKTPELRTIVDRLRADRH